MKIAQKEHAKKHYLANKELVKARAREWTSNQIRINKETIKSHLLKNPCIDCGERNPIVLEFDHRENKINNVSAGVCRGWSTNKLLLEMQKCDIRCANCHRVKTYKERGLTRYD